MSSTQTPTEGAHPLPDEPGRSGQDGLETELQRIADDAGDCAGQLSALARRWRVFQLTLASLAGILATSAGVTGITETVHPTFAGLKALAAAALGAAMTAMDPGRRAEEARVAAASYLTLHHRAHRVRSLDLPNLAFVEARGVVEELAQTHEGLTADAPPLRRGGTATGR